MKLFGAVIIFLLAFVFVIVLYILLFIRKGIMRFRQYLTGDYDDETFRRMADKYYRESDNGSNFDKDYFKGTGSNRRGGAGSYRSQQQTRQDSRQRTTTTTADGTTIIDERSQADRQKIFSDNEGEYVEFTEE